MSEIIQLNELPESITLEEQLSNNAVIDTKQPKSFEIQGVRYIADFSCVTRNLRKELKRNIFASQKIKEDGKPDMSGTFLIDNIDVMDSVNEILTKKIFGIPENVDINALASSEIDPIVEYVESLDLLGLAVAKA